MHSARLVRGVVEAAIRHGAKLSIATVVRIDQRDGERVVVTDKGEIRTQAVVLGLNAWSRQIAPAFNGIITPVRGQIMNTAPIAPVFAHGMGTDITPTGEYWQQTLDGSIVLGDVVLWPSIATLTCTTLASPTTCNMPWTKYCHASSPNLQVHRSPDGGQE